MRRGYFIFIVMFTLSLVSSFVNTLPMFAQAQSIESGAGASQMQSALNGTDILNNWVPSSTSGIYGDLKAGAVNLNRLTTFITSFPNIWRSLMPINDTYSEALISVFSGLWGLIWFLTVVDLISGGRIYGL